MDMKPETGETPEVKYERTNGHGTKVMVWLGGIIVFFVLIVGVSMAAFHLNTTRVQGGFMGGPQRSGMMRAPYGARGGVRMMNGVTSNEQRLSGVVTTVNGTSYTIAGGGKSNTVQTDGNTRYVNDKKPAVNDSVTVLGTTNNGTFTASEVVVE